MTETRIVLGLLAALVGSSYVVEALRRAPRAPERLAWATHPRFVTDLTHPRDRTGLASRPSRTPREA